MQVSRFAALPLLILAIASANAANPFLNAADDRPVSAEFRGAEWGDDIPQDELPLTARVVTTRIAKMPWGAIYKVEFTALKSHAKEHRQIPPEYFIATDDRIVLLNEEDMAAALKQVSAMDKPPESAPGDIYGITTGKFTHDDGNWETKIEVKGDLSIYLTSHSSGHFKKVVWKKGVGLVEHSARYGAMKDGYRLKRTSSRGR